jgi:alpha-tubulin suppressor-like RCC1 family protein
MPLGSFRLNGIAKLFPVQSVVISGPMYAWGSNFSYSTGLNTDSGNTLSITQMGSATNWSNVVAGPSSGFAINVLGQLWGWGDNTGYQIGVPAVGNFAQIPTRIGSATNWAQVSSGSSHTMAITTSGQLWGWGSNFSGQLGRGNTDDQTTPVRIGSASNWAQVSCGNNHTMAITTTGELWACGLNSGGQLGRGNTTSPQTSLVRIGSASNWSKVFSASDFNILLTTSGQLWGCGNNFFGQIGIGNTTTPQTSIVQIGSATNWAQAGCGRDGHVMAITTSGQLWGWGNNSNGQLGRGNTTSPQTSPVQIGSATNWAQVSCGTAHTLAITTTSELWASGRNTAGQLGRGDTTSPQTSMVQIGSATNWAQVSANSNRSHAITK